MDYLKLIGQFKKIVKSKKKGGKEFEDTEFENTEFEDTNNNSYDDLVESIEPKVNEEGSQTKTKKIKVNKKKVAVVAIPILALIGVLKLLGGESNQEDAIYKWGQTNNIEPIELKKGFEVESGTSVIQEIHGDDVTTMLLTEEGLTDITKYKKKIDDLKIDFFKDGIVSAHEARVELESMNGQENYPKKFLPEGSELLIYPDYFLYQDGMYHVRDIKTGEEGFVNCLLIDKGEDIEFTPPKEEESPIHIVSNMKNKTADILNTKYASETYQENVGGYLGSFDGKIDFTIATVDEDNPEFYRLMDKGVYLDSDEVVDLYQLASDGIEETRDTSIMLQDTDEKNKIEKNHFEFGVVANEALVGEGFFSKGKNIEPGSLFFEFPGEKCVVVTQNGLVNISSADKEMLDIKYRQTGTVFGNGKSVSIRDSEGKKQEGKYIVDRAKVTTLPKESIVTDKGTLIPIFDEKTKTEGYVYESDIPDLEKEQIECPSDSELLILKTIENTPIRTSKQNKKGYEENIEDTILQNNFTIVEVREDVTYEMIDWRFPELNGGLIVDDTTIPVDIITSDGIEEIKQPKEKEEENGQGEKTSLRDVFIETIAIDNSSGDTEISNCNKLDSGIKIIQGPEEGIR